MSRIEVRERWTGLLAEQASSGMPAAAWCKEREINVASLYAWRKRLGHTSDDTPVSFVEITPAFPPASGLELMVGRVCVRVAPGFDRHVLGDVLDVLEGRPC